MYFVICGNLHISRKFTNHDTYFTRVAPNLTFSKSAGAELLKLVFWSQNNTPVIKLMASTMLSAAIEAVQFGASFDALLFASYF